MAASKDQGARLDNFRVATTAGNSLLECQINRTFAFSNECSILPRFALRFIQISVYHTIALLPDNSNIGIMNVSVSIIVSHFINPATNFK